MKEIWPMEQNMYKWFHTAMNQVGQSQTAPLRLMIGSMQILYHQQFSSSRCACGQCRIQVKSMEFATYVGMQSSVMCMHYGAFVCVCVLSPIE